MTNERTVQTPRRRQQRRLLPYGAGQEVVDGKKPCVTCARRYPATPEFFARGGGSSGLHSSCNPCSRAITRENKARSRAALRAEALLAEPPQAARQVELPLPPLEVELPPAPAGVQLPDYVPCRRLLKVVTLAPALFEVTEGSRRRGLRALLARLVGRS